MDSNPRYVFARPAHPIQNSCASRDANCGHEIKLAESLAARLLEEALPRANAQKYAEIPQDRSAARSGARTIELGTIGGVFVWLGDAVKPVAKFGTHPNKPRRQQRGSTFEKIPRLKPRLNGSVSSGFENQRMKEIAGAPGTVRTSAPQICQKVDLYNYRADRSSEGTNRRNRRGANGRTDREIWIAYSIAYGLLTVKTAKSGFIEILQYGGGGRTRTYEVIRRLIYSRPLS